jgi:hypothetical protein
LYFKLQTKSLTSLTGHCIDELHSILLVFFVHYIHILSNSERLAAAHTRPLFEMRMDEFAGAIALAQTSACSSSLLPLYPFFLSRFIAFPSNFFQGFFLNFNRFCSGVGRVQHLLAPSHPVQSTGRCLFSIPPHPGPNFSWVSYPRLKVRTAPPVVPFLVCACHCPQMRRRARIFSRMMLRRPHILLPTCFSFNLFCALHASSRFLLIQCAVARLCVLPMVFSGFFWSFLALNFHCRWQRV